MTITKARKEFKAFPELPEAISLLTPGCGFTIAVKPGFQDYDWSTLVWMEENPFSPPTEMAARNKLQELVDAWEAEKYKYDRFMAYPTIESQLALLYDDIKSGTPLEQGEWFQSITQVKQDIPKT